SFSNGALLLCRTKGKFIKSGSWIEHSVEQQGTGASLAKNDDVLRVYRTPPPQLVTYTGMFSTHKPQIFSTAVYMESFIILSSQLC
uniref:Ig-like domain-containing protein n=1 Tax=Steinernema glaseri TaxID=37863 RepID=A0A1I8AER7_9BILA